MTYSRRDAIYKWNGKDVCEYQWPFPLLHCSDAEHNTQILSQLNSLYVFYNVLFYHFYVFWPYKLFHANCIYYFTLY